MADECEKMPLCVSYTYTKVFRAFVYDVTYSITFVLAHCCNVMAKIQTSLCKHYISLLTCLEYIVQGVLLALVPFLALQHKTKACRATPGRKRKAKSIFVTELMSNVF